MISAKPWSVEAVMRLFAGVIATFLAGSILVGVLQAARGHAGDDKLDFWQMVTAVVFFQGAALVWIKFFLRGAQISWSAAFGLAPRLRTWAILIGLAAGIIALPVMWGLQSLSQSVMELCHLQPAEQAAVEALQSPDLSVVQQIILGGFTVLVAPVAEEALFRGIAYPFFKQMGWPGFAFWGTSFFFGALHFNLATLVPLAVFGLLLIYLYEFTGSLLAPIAAHCLFNGVNFLYLMFAEPINKLLHLK